MALNPPLDQNRIPLRIAGEFFVMKRGHISFEFKVQRGNTYKGDGDVILTTNRIICVNKKQGSFKAFEVPIGLTTKASFEQPIFGANYLTGKCNPLMNILPGETTFKIWFMSGGFGTFVPTYLKMIHSAQKNQRKMIDQNMMMAFQSGNYKQVGYTDPNDPSVIYLEQPKIIKDNPYESCAGYNGQNPYAPFIPVMQQPQQQQQPQTGYQPIPQYDQPAPPQYQPQQPQYQPVPQYNQPQPQYQPQQPQYHQPQYQPQQPQYNQPQYQPQPQYNQPQYGMNNINQQGQVNEMNYPTQEELLQHQPNNNLYPGAPNQLPPNCNPNNIQQQQQQQPSYPYQDPSIMQGTNIQSNLQPNQQQQNGPKYFGFFGPQLKKNY